ncbi:hypothetical protein BH09MYX1_BH09MYX1_08710 [soil metagenome]
MRALLLVFVAFAAASCAGPPPAPRAPKLAPSPAIVNAVDALDRIEDDRRMDDARHPKELLAFFGVAPGMKVADLGSGRGYTAELLARVVGSEGKLWGQNSAKLIGFVSGDWATRLAKPVMKNAVRVDREFGDPLPEDARDLDLVTMVLIYHDTVWMGVDRDAMNRAVFAALVPGGIFGVVEHSARAGDGTKVVQTLHRIEEATLKEEVLRAGFVFDGETDVLRNPADPRDWNDAPAESGDRRGTSDRFVIRFKKPLNAPPTTRPAKPKAPAATRDDDAAESCTRSLMMMHTLALPMSRAFGLGSAAFDRGIALWEKHHDLEAATEFVQASIQFAAAGSEENWRWSIDNASRAFEAGNKITEGRAAFLAAAANDAKHAAALREASAKLENADCP